MSRNSSSGIKLEDVAVILELGYHNRELSFLLFGRNNNRVLLPAEEIQDEKVLFFEDKQGNESTVLLEFERREEVDEVLTNPAQYLNSLKNTLNTISCIIADIKNFSNENHINIDTTAKDVTDDVMNYYRFRYFSTETINSISYLYLEDPSTVADLALTVQYSYDCFIQMKADLLVTIDRFKKYIRHYTHQSRNKLIEQYYVDNSY